MEPQMKAYVTSIGEPTTDLCVWALERNGFDVILIKNQSTLWAKLKDIYHLANFDNQPFLRVDADVIVNKNMIPQFLSWLELKDPNIWWWQFKVFDMLKLDTAHQMAYIKPEAFDALVKNIDRFDVSNRPETEMSRIKAFYDPRRFDTYEDEFFGLHGFKADIEKAKELKHVRNQQDLYDFEMAERLNRL